ncbi:cobalt-precorrin-8X methylmutase [Trichothermofontia sp.]
MHPILQQSFAHIDREIGPHSFTTAEYAIVQRVIHSTADFEFKDLIRFSPDAIVQAVTALRAGVPIVVDVGMVKQGVQGMIARTLGNPLLCAVEQVTTADPNRTRTETGLLQCWRQYPHAIYVIGNAPTALLALCEQVTQAPVLPALIIGVPVGFVAVVESKAILRQTPVPKIWVEGRKGGSAVAAAIVNALLLLAISQEPSPATADSGPLSDPVE